ncbi:flavin reductase family protein [Streptomyces sp. NPDC097619]|uniref:flavin reductase family protein n=1 Tax=Streptomyces sp. NPDC097619 TaxID=3157228 RepID=UPI00333233D6
MYVVTVAADGERAGCLVGFASQSSIDPPRFTVWLSVVNHTYRVARTARHLTVHLLHPGDRDLAEHFGGRTGDDVDKFAGVDWRPGPEGGPVLERASTWFTGRIEALLDGRPGDGDHVGFVLAPVAVSPAAPGGPRPPLRYRDVRDLRAGHPA